MYNRIYRAPLYSRFFGWVFLLRTEEYKKRVETRNLFFRFTFALLRAEKRGGTAKCLTTPQRNKKEIQYVRFKVYRQLWGAVLHYILYLQSSLLFFPTFYFMFSTSLPSILFPHHFSVQHSHFSTPFHTLYYSLLSVTRFLLRSPSILDAKQAVFLQQNY